VYFQQYVQYYSADQLKGTPFADPDLEAWISLSQLIYQSDQPVCGDGTWGIDLIVPVVSLDISGTPLSANDTGIGDVLIGPYLQWVVMGSQGPVFAHRVEAQVLLPVGKYDEAHDLNPGSNVLSLDPYWAGTFFLGPKASMSARVHYLWNEENDDPALSSGADKIRAGEAIHANFAAEYEVAPSLRIGLNGYYLDQISDTEVNGTEVNGRQEKVLALGPGALYSVSKDTHLFANAYFETDAENRPEGDRYNVRFVHHF
jgi:anthranilate 1,2-dioxygenase (deaminating, decarboxylating) large subunit